LTVSVFLPLRAIATLTLALFAFDRLIRTITVGCWPLFSVASLSF
jgi:hypothetical protein